MGKARPIHRKTGGGDSNPGLGCMGGLVLEYIKQIPGELFDWSSRSDVSDGLRRDGILNTAPSTTILIKRRPHSVRSKNQDHGKV